MKRWDLRSLAPSTKKQVARAPGVDALRVPRTGSQMPRVLFTSPECRAVVIDLRDGEELGDHRVRERAVVEVVAGRVSVECSGETVDCDTGTLVTFDPGEHHKVRALADSRLLLLLAPWPALDHNSNADHDQHLPANAVAEPIRRPARSPTSRHSSVTLTSWHRVLLDDRPWDPPRGWEYSSVSARPASARSWT